MGIPGHADAAPAFTPAARRLFAKMKKGIDIVSVERIRRAARKRRFLERVFTEEELRYAFSRKDPFRHLAGRFASKEAFLKALGTGLASGLGWRDVEVVKDGRGRPSIKAGARAAAMAKGRIFLSMAYFRDMAVAVVAIDRP